MNILHLSVIADSQVEQPAVIAVLALLLAPAALLLVANQTAEYSFWSRIVAWRQPRVDDFVTKVPARPIQNGPVVYYLRPAPITLHSYLNEITYRQTGRETTMPLEDFLISTGTTAFWSSGMPRSSTRATFTSRITPPSRPRARWPNLSARRASVSRSRKAISGVSMNDVD